MRKFCFFGKNWNVKFEYVAMLRWSGGGGSGLLLFASRESQIAASISQQSQPIETRLELERRYEEFERKHNSDLVLPEHWRGYRLLPSRYEFWQGRRVVSTTVSNM